jgi:molybdopterin-binding protein
VPVSRQRPDGKKENTWPGQISAVDLMGDRVRVRVTGTPSITAEVPPSAVDELKLDDGGAVGLRRPVRCFGLPTVITKERNAMQLSARNQIPARVTGITSGEAIANVALDANGVRLVASITVEAVRQLGLKEGSDVTAIIKASEVILATGD